MFLLSPILGISRNLHLFHFEKKFNIFGSPYYFELPSTWKLTAGQWKWIVYALLFVKELTIQCEKDKFMALATLN